MTVRGPTEFQDQWRYALEAWRRDQGTARLWNRDARLWSGADEASWLAWLDAPDTSDADLTALASRLAAALPPGITDVLLIGMGGSSLGAEVIAATAARDAGSRSLHVLDSTQPTAVVSVVNAVDWTRTAVVVASKSGTTLEPAVLFAHALAAATDAIGAAEAGRRVVAVTDPGSALAAHAREIGAAAVVEGEPQIGGRYSVLSPFGLVPAALLGVDLPAFMAPARTMASSCRTDGTDNPGVALGVFMGCAARAGRDKCTLLLPAELAPLGAWIEQLVAESTGKRGVGVLPIDGEAPGAPDAYGSDRAFVHVGGASGSERLAERLAAAGHPVFTIDRASAHGVAAEFVRWEIATAVAGAVLGVNPFDQPDVEASKVAARALTDAFERTGALPPDADAGPDLTSLLGGATPPSYVALLAYLPMQPDVIAALQRTRGRIRDARRVATSLGFGPRYLHSTGQAFKGGPPTGAFIQVTCDAASDAAIPGRRLTFGAVVGAQAAGDRSVLRDRGRPVAHVHLTGELSEALGRFDAEVQAALERAR